MEFVDGVNLRQAMKAGNLKPAEALKIVPQICDALQFAHDEGIVHRDIKPENILIGKKGRVKIADFGLAKLLGKTAPDISLTGTQQVMGTLHYMAPEQLEGSRDIDHRADIYSLGVTFYEMLTGELPLGRFAAPSKKVEIDVRLDEVVLRSLEKEPEQRYQHASEIKTDLDAMKAEPPQEPVAALEPDGEIVRAALRARTTRKLVSIGVGGGMTTIGLLCAFGGMLFKAQTDMRIGAGDRVAADLATFLPIFVPLAVIGIGLVAYGLIHTFSEADREEGLIKIARKAAQVGDSLLVVSSLAAVRNPKLLDQALPDIALKLAAAGQRDHAVQLCQMIKDERCRDELRAKLAVQPRGGTVERGANGPSTALHLATIGCCLLVAAAGLVPIVHKNKPFWGMRCNFDGPGQYRVTEIENHSPALKGGLKFQDVILAINRTIPMDFDEAARFFDRLGPGEPAYLQVARLKYPLAPMKPGEAPREYLSRAEVAEQLDLTVYGEDPPIAMIYYYDIWYPIAGGLAIGLALILLATRRLTPGWRGLIVCIVAAALAIGFSIALMVGDDGPAVQIHRYHVLNWGEKFHFHQTYVGLAAALALTALGVIELRRPNGRGARQASLAQPTSEPAVTAAARTGPPTQTPATVGPSKVPSLAIIGTCFLVAAAGLVPIVHKNKPFWGLRGTSRSRPNTDINTGKESVLYFFLVSLVDADSPAEAAGLQGGDQITRLNGKPLDPGMDVTESLEKLRPGETAELDFFRPPGMGVFSTVTADAPPIAMIYYYDKAYPIAGTLAFALGLFILATPTLGSRWRGWAVLIVGFGLAIVFFVNVLTASKFPDLQIRRYHTFNWGEKLHFHQPFVGMAASLVLAVLGVLELRRSNGLSRPSTPRPVAAPPARQRAGI